MAICRAFSGWTQDDSYRKERGSRTERGVRAYSPAWSELPTRNWVSGVEWDKRGHNSGMIPVNRKAGTGERTREPPGGNAWYLYSPVGFRHHWFERQILWCLSGGRSLWKTGNTAAFFSLSSSLMASSFDVPVPSARRSRTTERSESVSEEAEYLRPHVRHLTLRNCIFS